jgi:hypothetical protein
MTCPQEIVDRLITEAVDRHGEITPCTGRRTFVDSITRMPGMWVLWYNDASGSTHTVMEEQG